MTAGRWPGGRQAAACVTFDHLGEAAELQMESWPAHIPVGSHHSVSTELPNLLEMLRDRPVRSTFYLEAWNIDTYPDAVLSIADAGHDVGWHGWLHEPWSRTDELALRTSLDRSVERYDRLGIRPVAARPPAGLLGDHSLTLLREYGFELASLAGDVHGVQDGLALLPYPWTGVDGAYYIPGFTRLRKEESGDHPVGPDILLRAHQRFLEETIEAGGFASYVFHVCWQDTPDKVAAIATLMDRLDADDRVWHAQSAEIARWMRAHPEDFAGAAHVDAPPAW
ncbi:polysaccharide deacetylase family protein [Streptomyces sp. NBC_00257]|uniref:polysaccharide deacetylase family protein n=1 Tax=unclassified Streptomyces TaxID=2593676 RepID=UPI00225808ED|nr:MULTISPECIES: polysaccharide deacetylase family protein [unclassified Streptomyces]WSX06071.1 polysaccharide deacetylase family protein [Streptomyces sp. NBC_00987]MCX4398676.1 polysaccharide deacetylase family protein [Streptomyces sp. NBC_01767]MCX4870995.1 polysaccharide deacetylase family protein [Streptomyces sp. NBC_00906]MCX4901735.1 polysaccharide deacetylase family protein [Streptomyces sp. NBC_00892]MCX5103801.1 polysaccharide deacetylase family protein [Streptomyces sp. NBC_00439